MFKSTFSSWMYMNQTDPDGVLTWTIEQLKEAEAAGDKVRKRGGLRKCSIFETSGIQIKKTF